MMLTTYWLLTLMCLNRCLSLKDFPDFEELLVAGWNSIKGVIKFSELHIVFYRYIAGSLKECERERNSAFDSFEDIRFDSLFSRTEVPPRPEGFWACCENKKKLQNLSQIFFENHSKENNTSIILSGFLAFDINCEMKITCYSKISLPQLKLACIWNQAGMEKSKNGVMIKQHRRLRFSFVLFRKNE